ncbi:helix-turn-helix transcriptional regulator [Clostridiales Family XIII bacterium ASD5510]|uniref:Helix-turn-helix transcriptional regulator n=1 Tax=Hominibacterium faecale TaxID=2839743 RepID=A0A9J6R017_9FIRM|nr:helix-turn-helix transcriptional regulator [Hominibacterium faecale]MCU7381052.1 helix-turn-helix transcriptional regulator [Hominibacterium faecale]
MEFNLKAVREEIGISQSELAKKSGVGRVTINRIENGEVDTITSRTLVRLAKALNVSTDTLIQQ